MNKGENYYDKKEQALDAGLKSSRACPKEIKKLALLAYSTLIQQIKHFFISDKVTQIIRKTVKMYFSYITKH